ncbi:hypothetical protein Ait01nite_026010 [Actinoplanes italicus]|uniref:Uncharacterized protein n=1 Tax=Actinoplanes italicus TaxID=113567 RepID=A0A2T0KF82_9ACTN|nr:hypothetical protein [Actinoplanes italicus]PRX22025.1 hypothetical protein CLV67_105202 [Actinoplanes italicus]GIE29556.1 hypothetical protein Ait01nite_026010 [Actinoplanes italicus]
MTATGTLIGDSLRPGAEFAPRGARIRRVYRLDLEGTGTATQPPVWTVIEFETDDTEAAVEALAASLNPGGGWYADMRDGRDRIIVFAGTVFRYRPGDAEGRAAAMAHGRAAGVPEHQLDWPD